MDWSRCDIIVYMSMPIEKAKKVLKAYKGNNYNAEKALTSVGYSSTTAEKQSARTIDTAARVVASSGEKDAILEFLGMTETDLASEYGKIIKQDKNYPAKLRALEPLLAKKGIKWDNEKINITPKLNLTVNEVPAEPQQSPDKATQLIDVSSESAPIVAEHAENGSTEPDTMSLNTH